MLNNIEYDADSHDWGSDLDDADGDYWEEVFASAEFETMVEEPRCEGDEILPLTLDQAQEEYTKVRSFIQFKESQYFLKKLVDAGDGDAFIKKKDDRFEVHYSGKNSNAGENCRSGQRYSLGEVRFILKHYLNWAPVSAIAFAVDRSEQNIETWLAKRGLAMPRRNKKYGIGELSNDKAWYLCDQIEWGNLFGDSLELLQKIGVLIEPILHTPDLNPYVTTKKLSNFEKRRIMEFALDYGRFDVAFSFALQAEQYGQAFSIALQTQNRAGAIAAISTMPEPPIYVQKIRHSALQYIRTHVREKLADFLGNWNISEINRRRDYGYTGKSDVINVSLLAKDFRVGVDVGVDAIAPELKTLYFYLKEDDEILEEQALDGNLFAAWALADRLRKIIYQRGVSDKNTECEEKKLEEIERIVQDFSLDAPGIIMLLNSALPLDPVVPPSSGEISREKLKAIFQSKYQEKW